MSPSIYRTYTDGYSFSSRKSRNSLGVMWKLAAIYGAVSMREAAAALSMSRTAFTGIFVPGCKKMYQNIDFPEMACYNSDNWTEHVKKHDMEAL